MLTSINGEHGKALDALLLELLVRAEAAAVFLCDRGGYIMARQCTEAYAHEDNMAALAAGSFFATRELARLIGEPEFRSVFHQGDISSVYMQLLGMDMLLLVIYGQNSNPGLVRLYAEESCGALLNEIDHMREEAGSRQGGQPLPELIVEAGGPIFQPASGQGHD